MTEQQKHKQHIRAFMQAHYTDERLAQLLAHAQDGKLAFDSCCCFIGATTAQHSLQPSRQTTGYQEGWVSVDGQSEIHTALARVSEMAVKAETAFCHLTTELNDDSRGDSVRRRILIPMIRAEMRRRERARGVQPEFSTTAQRFAEPAL